MSDNIVEFPDPNECIEGETWIPVLDAKPEDMARRMKDRSWEARLRIFDNLITDSIEKAVLMCEAGGPEPDDPMYSDEMLLAAVLVGISEQIESTLDLWPEPDPMPREAAELYLLSLSPVHRRKGRAYFKDRDVAFQNKISSPGLAQFARIAEVARPGLSEIWRLRRSGCECICDRTSKLNGDGPRPVT